MITPKTSNLLQEPSFFDGLTQKAKEASQLKNRFEQLCDQASPKLSYLAAAMQATMDAGAFSLVLANYPIDTNAYIIQAWLSRQALQPILYVGDGDECLDFLLAIATRHAQKEIFSPDEVKQLPTDTQDAINEISKNVRIAPLNDLMGFDAVKKAVEPFLGLKKLHVVCKVNFLRLADQEFISHCARFFGEHKNISCTFLCDQEWVLLPAFLKSGQKNFTFITDYLPLKEKGRTSLNVKPFSQVNLLRAGPVTRGQKLDIQIFEKAMEKEQAVVFEFFCNKNLWEKGTPKERRFLGWFSKSKNLYTETKPENQSFVPKIWANVS